MKMEVPLTSPEAKQFAELGGVLDFDQLSNARENSTPKPKRAKLFTFTSLAISCDFLAFGLAFLGWYVLTRPLLGEMGFYSYLAGCLATILLPIMVVGGYSRFTEVTSARFLSEHIIASLIATTLLVSFLSLVSLVEPDSKLGHLYAHGVLVSFSVLFSSVTSKRFLESRRKEGDRQRYLFVVGATDNARELYALHKSKGDRRKMRVFDFDLGKYGQKLVPHDPKSPTVEHIPANDFPKIGDEVDTIVISGDPDQLPVSFVNHLMAVNLIDYKVETARKFISSEHKKVSLDGLSSNWFFEGGFRLLENTAYYRTKCIIDISLSAVAIVMLSPLLFCVGLAVKLTSKGPIFFTQQRVGVGGVPFKLYKFRTMKVGSEKGHLYTLENDPRITKIGNFLRRTRLDELPQLFNVIRGEMSLVGPRAEWTRCVEGYEANIPFYHYRHLVKPGITGWAQVNYPYGENEHDTIEKLKYDLYYVRHFSLILDFSIFVKTIYVMLGKHGSR